MIDYINKKLAIRKLLEIQKNNDSEVAHGDTDEALRKLLVLLGYEDVVKEYDKIDKWYA